MNALYHLKLDHSSQEIRQGYVKAAVSNKLETDHGKKWAVHPYYHVFFIPFTIDNGHYSLQRDSLLIARDVSPVHWSTTQVKREMVPPAYPSRESPRLEAIVEKLQTNLPEITGKAKPLKYRKLFERRSFLGQFPQPLREGIEEEVMYGTIDKKKIQYLIYEHELSTYVAEDVIPRNPTLAERSSMPVKLFHRH